MLRVCVHSEVMCVTDLSNFVLQKWVGKVISLEMGNQQGREELVVKDSKVGSFIVSSESGRGHTIKIGILMYKI